VAEISARITAARRALSATDVDRELRPSSGDLFDLWPSVDPGSVTRDTWGRAASATLLRDAVYEGISLPRGTVLHLAHINEWRAPTTPDRIKHVELGGSAYIPSIGKIAQPGATLLWVHAYQHLMIERAFAGEVEIEGWRVNGAKWITIDERGCLCGFTTAAPIQIGSLPLPVGASFSRHAGVINVFRPAGEPGFPGTYMGFRLTERGQGTTLTRVLREPRPHLHPRVKMYIDNEDVGDIMLWWAS
jgi:hypothetical protein